MAGYCEFSKSNNAIQAERDGLMTATAAARALKVSSRAIKEVLDRAEWHHTSGWFNRTDYYDVQSLLDPAGLDDEEAAKTVARLRARDAELKKSVERVWENCTVEWLEWSGSRRHPKATERKAGGCRVIWSGGAFCLFVYKAKSYDGVEREFAVRKKTNCNGFNVYFERQSTADELAASPNSAVTRRVYVRFSEED